MIKPAPDPAMLALRLTQKAAAALDEIAEEGIYGATAEEVARRFVDERLQEFHPWPGRQRKG